MKNMKVLYISSGNKEKNKISSIVYNQAISLKKKGVQIDFYAIKGKGLLGYLQNRTSLKKKIKLGHYDLFHAHYSFSGILAALSNAKPLVVSLMGSEVHQNKKYFLLKFFIWFLWSRTIVKSQRMKQALGIKAIEIIPNGVNLEKFKPMPINDCKAILGWDLSKRNVLFASSPKHPVKNFKLAHNAIKKLTNNDIEIKFLDEIPNHKTPLYFNAADIVLLTSLSEGSPNVIKEAMACNRPIVSTKVGDVAWLLGDQEGHFLSSFCPTDLGLKIKAALDYSQKNQTTNGRNRIIELKLDSHNTANKLLGIYNELIH